MRSLNVAAVESLESRVLFAAGDLDTSFSGDGKLVALARPAVNAMVVLPDGKMLVTGGAQQSGFIARYNINGTLDTTFGGDGNTDGIRALDTTLDMVRQSDGKIVLVSATHITRLNGNGSPDFSFTPAAFAHNTGINARVALGPNGTIYVATQNSGAERTFYVYRFTSSGAPDTVWGRGAAEVLLTPAQIGIEQLRDLAVQSDGKVLVSGQFGPIGGNADFGVYRMDTIGDVDPSFGDNGPTGVALVDFGGRDIAPAMALQTDGKIILGGWAGITSTQPAQRFALARLTTAGRPDTTFDNDGKKTTAPLEGGTSGNVRTVSIQQNGKIVAGGVVDGKFCVLRYLSNGTLDSSFGGNGMVFTDLGGSSQSSEIPENAGIAFDGKIVLAGAAFDTNQTSLAMARFIGDPTGAITGNVFSDVNGNAAKNTGEGNLANVRVYIDKDNDNIFDSGVERGALTDSSGNFRIGTLATGTYRLRAVTPTGTRRTLPSAGFYDVSVTNGSTVGGRNFGFVPPDPDDTISEVNNRTGNQISVGGAVNFTITEPRDVDIVRFTVTAGQRVAFDVDRASGSSLNSFLRLFNSAGTQLASNDNGIAPGETSNSADSFLTFTFTTAGTYYIAVSASLNRTYSATAGNGDVDGGSTGGYRLSLVNIMSV